MLTPADGMTITRDTCLQPGVYLLPDGLAIGADGITLDGNGATLVGAGGAGCGVSLRGRRNVTLKNLRLLNYRHGISARDCQRLTISECQVNLTAELRPNTVFLDIWESPERAPGGGILLWDVSDSQVTANDLQHQLCGLLTYGCRGLTVRENVANYCSGWGFHLHNTCDSLFEANYADFCCRYEPRGAATGHMGADAAGFLIVYNSSRNVFRGNSARLGGDGFFLAGMTPAFEPAPCDDNLFEANDGSYSPNIAFEATFSCGNVYRNNRADHCNYGFWLGFSRQFTLEGNHMLGNHQAGVAVENGFGFQVCGNTFRENGHGVLLWSKRVPDYSRAVQENDTSFDWRIEDNLFEGNRTAIRIAADQDHGIRPLPSNGERGYPAPPPHDHLITSNTIAASRTGVELRGAVRTTLADNRFMDNVENESIEN